MTTAQVAQYLHVNPQTVFRMVQDGRLVANRVPGTRRYLYWRSDIVRLLAANPVSVEEAEAEAEAAKPRKVKRAGR